MKKYTPEQLDFIFEQVKELVGDVQNKLKALDLREFIDKLYPREGEATKQDLADVTRRIVSLNTKVNKIEGYLRLNDELDRFDKIEVNVDYSFLKENLRLKATAFYWEMLRYELGTKIHKQCFGEFCRLAIIQVELLLNYFFSENVELLINYEYSEALKKWKKDRMKYKEPLKKTFEDKYEANKEDVISKLDYSKKSKAFCDIFNLGSISSSRNNNMISISMWAANMRNRKSHGSWKSIGPYEENYLSEDEINNLNKLEEDIQSDVKSWNEKHAEKAAFEVEEKCLKAKKVVWKNEDFADLMNKYNNEYRPLLWISQKPFDDVHELLRVVASTCAKNLINVNGRS